MTARYTLNIHSNIRNYTAEIHTDYSFLDQLAELPNAAVLVDRKVYDLYTEIITKRFPEEKIFLFDATENNKTFDAASEIYTWLITKFAARKNLNFISIGGGITLDVSGFVALALFTRMISQAGMIPPSTSGSICWDTAAHSTEAS